ncbi:CDGSH iron-sulfur domain-containing protein [Streptomyces sp. NPDC004051]
MVSQRFTVAVCTCRRSRIFPWCDTSHRRRGKPSAGPGSRSERTERTEQPERPGHPGCPEAEPDRGEEGGAP